MTLILMTQIRKGSKYLVFFVVLFTALPPFAIDAYIPAFGNISKDLNVDPSQLTITISAYLFGFAAGILVWGAISDRFGRKKILIIGMIIYIISSIICSLTNSFDTLIYMRFLQGIGDSPAAVASGAILKDCYRGQKLIKMMATMIMIFMIAPIVAPILGSVIIYMTGDWRNIFHALTLYGFVLLFITFLMPETHKGTDKNLFQSFIVYFKHISNKSFILASISNGLCFGILFTFIISSSNLIIVQYKLGYIDYCALFAINILGIIISSNIVRKSVTTSNQFAFIKYGYLASIVIIIINIALVNTVHNLYLFIFINAVSTACVSLVSIVIGSKSMDLLKDGYAAGSAIVRLIRFVVAGFVGISLGYVSLSKLMVTIPVQQLIIILLSLAIFCMVRKKIFSES